MSSRHIVSFKPMHWLFTKKIVSVKKSANTIVSGIIDLLCLQDIVSLVPSCTFFTETENINMY